MVRESGGFDFVNVDSYNSRELQLFVLSEEQRRGWWQHFIARMGKNILIYLEIVLIPHGYVASGLPNITRCCTLLQVSHLTELLGFCKLLALGSSVSLSPLCV